jgi:hypothetical protein
MGGRVDGGIQPGAKTEFWDWCLAVQRHMNEVQMPKLNTAEDLLAYYKKGQTKFQTALDKSTKEYETYLAARKWAEFDTAGREPAGYSNPHMYGALMFMRFEEMPWDQAEHSYLEMAGLMGLSLTEDVDKKVHAAPKDKFGVVVSVTPFGLEFEHETPNGVPIDRGLMPAAGSRPSTVMIAMLGCCDARRYMLTQFATASGGALYDAEPGRYQWKFADQAYKRWVEAFGEADVLKAADTVRTSTKTVRTGSIIDPHSIGALRGDPVTAFQDILVRNSPRGYVRAVLAFNQKLDTTSALDTAYQKLTAAYGGEPAVLEKATRLASRSGTYASAYPAVMLPSEMKYLTGVLDGSMQVAAPKTATPPSPLAPSSISDAPPTVPCSPPPAAPRGKGSPITPNVNPAGTPCTSGTTHSSLPTVAAEPRNPPSIAQPIAPPVATNPVQPASQIPAAGQRPIRVTSEVTTVDQIDLVAANEGRDIHAKVVNAFPRTIMPIGTDIYLKAAIQPQLGNSHGRSIWVSLVPDYAVLDGKHVPLNSNLHLTVFLIAGSAVRPGMTTVGGASVVPPNKEMRVDFYVGGN